MALPLVLIADANGRSRVRRAHQLEDRGFRVAVARTGFETIVKASCHVPDVILLDETVTGIDVTETVRMLRTCPTTSHIPIVRLFSGRRLAHRTLARLRRVAA